MNFKSIVVYTIKFLGCFTIAVLVSCSGGGGSDDPVDDYAISVEVQRIEQAGFDPFTVIATLTNRGTPLSGQTLSVNVAKGSVSTVTDNGDGSYQFTVTPSSTGVYPFTINYQGASISRAAIVFDGIGSGVGQPMSVPGDYVNTEGYEDGVTITPDGQWLFVQYGPVYFSGALLVNTICSDINYSIGYNLNDCNGRDNSNWIFESIGPYTDSVRPGFPSARLSGGMISHLSSIVLAGVANGLYVPPTVFYGFKRQGDGTFAEPFLLAFDDEGRGVQSPYGLSFQMLTSNTARFTLSWNDYTNQLGDDGVDLYSGTVTLGQNNSLGSVTFAGELPNTITPNVVPVSLDASDQLGVQGNSHIYYDNGDVVQSIWTDDEKTTKDLTVYTRTAGTFPNGTWVKVTLPAKINTAGEESQPFFTGTKLYLRRGDAIVYHDYAGMNGTDYDQDVAWGDEVIVLQSNISTVTGETVAVGEPTIANINGKTLLYFVYGINRSTGLNGLIDINMDAGFVELTP